jgi:GNAT superfamily N-acetyltransferase
MVEGLVGTDILRTAVAADAPAMAEVDRQSWPEELATTRDQFEARIAAYPDGQWVADEAGRILGVASAQRITEVFLQDNGASYAALTDGNRFTCSHTPDGEIYQLVGVGVSPKYWGRQLGRKLVDQQIAFARSLPGVRRIVGYTRPARYYRHQQMTIEEYVAARREDGRLIDPILAFHLEAGARLVAIQPNFRPNDRQACGYGVLIEYPV